MASTLLLTDDHAPGSSAQLKMPQVFVVPPDEDDSPVWCCFDANMPPSSSTNASYTDSHYVPDMLQEDVDVPLFHYNLKEPRSLDTVPSGSDTRSIMDVLMNDDYMEFDNETRLDTEERGRDRDLETDVGNDSEVVEVVKVGRYTADVEEHSRTSTPPAHASKSFKARAFGVFRILKLVEKDTLRSRSKAQVILPQTNEGTRAKRNKSRHDFTPSSQLFHPYTTSQASQSVCSLDLVEVSSIPPIERPRYPLSLRNVSLPTSSSTVSANLRSPLRASPTRPVSSRRHFSMTINRIFSFSRSDEVSNVFPVSRSDKPLGPSTDSTPEPGTPTEEAASSIPEHTLLPAQKRLPPGDSACEKGDLSFTMRLDSLHFDSLSFDVDKF